MSGGIAQIAGGELALLDPVVEGSGHIPAADPLQGDEVVLGLGCDLGWLEYLHLAAEHSCRGQMLQEVGLDSHPGCPVKPVDPLPAEGLALEGYLGGYDLVEDGDVIGE